MRPSPISATDLADAIAALTDAGKMGALDRGRRHELVVSAFAVLRRDRMARHGQPEPPTDSGRVICIPRALFESGRPTRRRPRLIVLPSGGPTPGNAA